VECDWKKREKRPTQRKGAFLGSFSFLQIPSALSDYGKLPTTLYSLIVLTKGSLFSRIPLIVQLNLMIEILSSADFPSLAEALRQPQLSLNEFNTYAASPRIDPIA
jgi:hypothetical protein